jgi:hypothetical protein
MQSAMRASDFLPRLTTRRNQAAEKGAEFFSQGCASGKCPPRDMRVQRFTPLHYSTFSFFLAVDGCDVAVGRETMLFAALMGLFGAHVRRTKRLRRGHPYFVS